MTLDLLPLIMTIAKEGRIEEEMYLTTFLFEEAKHMEFFRHALDQVGEKGDLSVYHSDIYKSIFMKYCRKRWGNFYQTNPLKHWQKRPLFIICLQRAFLQKLDISGSIRLSKLVK